MKMADAHQTCSNAIQSKYIPISKPLYMSGLNAHYKFSNSSRISLNNGRSFTMGFVQR